MDIKHSTSEFQISHQGRTIIAHSHNRPAFYLGRGDATFNMYRGNFDIADYLTERLALRQFSIQENSDNTRIDLSIEGTTQLSLIVTSTAQGRLKIAFEAASDDYNRIWLRVDAKPSDNIYGCGAQLSHFNLRGKDFPLWTSEPGVGRNKETYTTWQADVNDKAGGDYYTTNYPQPTFISSQKYFCHLQTTAWANFDFRHDQFHELQCWEIPEYLLFGMEDNYIDLMENFSDFFGRQPELPEWVYNGIILGIQGGTDFTVERVEQARKAGIKVSAAWCQDWQGIKFTSFGKRLQWNWQWNPEVYPDLDKRIHELKEDGIRFLGYINPYVLQDYPLYNEAKELGLLAKKIDGSDYVVDFGEFDCGVVDFTNPEGERWYKEVIKREMIDFGLDGWMADFGEYLPTDCVLHNGKSAELEHNDWPRRWAKINHEAIAESGKTDDILFFMRAGYTGIQGYCHTLWAGDQSVDWSMDDGLASVIPGALSTAMTGNGIHHSDIGGYTTLHGNKRDQELLLRWTEMAAFTPIMRSHEGNRPNDNHQYFDDPASMAHLASMTRVYTHLKPYLKQIVAQNAGKGTPVQRPLFMHYEQDETCYDIQYQYLLGPDILVAPVHQAKQSEWELYLPKDEWVHAWTGEVFLGGWITIAAPIGKPPVFYRKASKHSALFDGLVAQL
ncbi:alpha-glucosidase [Alginatibacterium sediminis]|uniref:Alpha-glucosidase n=1 Tax=Alginatibacterium sediminis TaxID=2164068 RepID=A0A420E677_9ALTE|nr:alpha-glucosidase [Alginatibacterium sediminis]RKF13238.1 alpha-glucosidase [Alginatibacterium sediminis]